MFCGNAEKKTFSCLNFQDGNDDFLTKSHLTANLKDKNRGCRTFFYTSWQIFQPPFFAHIGVDFLARITIISKESLTF